jgi:hypothetical protein
MTSRRAAALLLALALAACGKDTSVPTSKITVTPTGWKPVDGMICADGSGTGIGIQRGTSDDVIVFLSPGGACWNTATCTVSPLDFSRRVLRKFGSTDFDAIRSYSWGTIFDRTLAGNPFRTWTQVFVPYCTGDVHAGDTVRDHDGVTWQHHGWKNLEVAVAAITTELPRPGRLVVAGSSAGGFGALAAFSLLRGRWTAAGGTTAALLDDSAQTFDPDGMPSTLLARWWDVWGLGSTIGTVCPGCQGDLSQIWPQVQRLAPGDRLGLISTTRDLTMRGYFADAALGIAPQDGPTFQTHVDALAARLGGLGADVAMYRVAGAQQEQHALLAWPTFLASPQGPALLQWLGEMVSMDPAWGSSTSM